MAAIVASVASERRAFSAAQLQSVLENYELEVSSRLLMIRQNAEVALQSLRFRLEMEINKLPRQVLDLPMREFVNEYKGDVQLFFQQKTLKESEVENAISETMRRSTRKRGANGTVDQTPSRTGTKRSRAVPATPLQPLNDNNDNTARATRTATAKKGRAPDLAHMGANPFMTPVSSRSLPSIMFTPSRSVKGGADSHMLAVPLSSGDMVELEADASPSVLQQLPQETRAEVMMQLETMQQQLANFMAMLK